MKPLILGTRGSDLALAQTRHAAARLREDDPTRRVEERIIRTTGDARLDIDLSAPGSLDKGLFTKELEEALLRGEIDAAVHSLKDLPTQLPPGLAVGAVLEREDPADVLVGKFPGGLDAVPAGARVATSSLRRKSFLLDQRPDLEVVTLRGNVPTRIRRLGETPDLAAIVLARAGLRRLERAGVSLALDGLTVSPLPFMLPAPGQGAVAIECRADDPATHAALHPIHHEATALCANLERTVLAGLGGGCHLPLGVLATVEADGSLRVRAGWFPDSPGRFAEVTGPSDRSDELAQEILSRLRASR